MVARAPEISRGLAPQPGPPPPPLLPPDPLLPPAAAAAWREPLPKALYLHIAAAALSAMGQLLIIHREWATSRVVGAVALGSQSLVAAVNGLIVLALLRWPLLYWRHRAWITAVLRVFVFSLPTFRRTDVGLALMLQRPAAQGWRGALADLGRWCVGTRLLSNVAASLALVQDPATTLATQAAIAALSTDAQRYCVQPLLADPLSHQRMLGLAMALEHAALPLVFVSPPANHMALAHPAILNGQATHQQICCATTAWLHLAVGVLLPTLVAICAWRPPADAPAAPPAAPAWQRLAGRAQRASAACDIVLATLLPVGPGGPWLLRVFAIWYTLVGTWWASRISAGLL